MLFFRVIWRLLLKPLTMLVLSLSLSLSKTLLFFSHQDVSETHANCYLLLEQWRQQQLHVQPGLAFGDDNGVLMQSWYGSGECSLCDVNIGDTNDVLAMFGSSEWWCSGENGELSDTA